MASKEVPALVVELVAAQAISSRERSKFEDRYGREQLARGVESIERSNLAILADYPAEWMAERIRGRMADRYRRTGGGEPENRMSARIWRLLDLRKSGLRIAAAVGVALLVATFGLVARGAGEHDDGHAIREKGVRPELFVYERVPQGAVLLEEGDSVRAGDELQVAYRSAKAAFGVVVSIDGAGSVTVHLPANSNEAAPLEPGSRRSLPYAFQLDQDPYFERFFFVVSTRPFAVDQVVKSAKQLATTSSPQTERLQLPTDMEQTSLLLKKVGTLP